ncbi:two-component sensor histidine kinase [Sphingomonas trueperi]|uniref:ATP-binding protein n=1 Tax=Sphingomonas trueperi TaxID=53317 RepID=UPI0033922EFC
MNRETEASRNAMDNTRNESRSLIHLFSPTPPLFSGDAAGLQSRPSIWAEDSAHRAKNLSQLASALTRIRSPIVVSCDNTRNAQIARELAAAYAALAEEKPDGVPTPCAALLVAIGEGLVTLFGQHPQPVGLRCLVSEQWLSSHARRVLVLIASELIINALKYAFPTKGGSIVVTLGSFTDHLAMRVQDDGVGTSATMASGTGGRILDDLAAQIDARVERTQPSDGGLCVSVIMPLRAAR